MPSLSQRINEGTLGLNIQLFQSLTYLTHNWRLQFSKYSNWVLGIGHGAWKMRKQGTGRQGDKVT
ncbi:hypothetical protein A6769_06920 [Nostoc punctiforme NIES-2108]|uniref:Transposase DDE domain-containing protein n=1 Tax=Nostoc punctiforme NIES-2108 TaxID=1356359 RepID=A0A367RSH1_NOSPU|nr:hypothetical protein A6769_06920 [Nostoc punctiforme NIES-2108]